MKLLHVIASMAPISGGPCQGIRNSNTSLQNLGCDREVVCLDAPSASFIGKDSFPIHAIGPGKGVWAYCPALIPWLLNNIHRFDIILVNGIWQYHAYATRKALEIYEKQVKDNHSVNKKIPKLFVMPHGMLDPYFQRSKTRRLKAIRNWFYWRLIEKKLVNKAFGMLFTSEEELLLARETFGQYHPQREFNVGYGIDEPPEFTTEMRASFLKSCPALNTEPYILFLSRIHEKKGVDLLIEAYLLCIKNASTKMPKLVIAGPGQETNYGKKLQKLINGVPDLAESILFTGMLTGDAKWGAIYGCDAFVLPSHQENFGIAVAEALACAKAVLISNKVNIWREIEMEGGGIITDDSLNCTQEMLAKWFSLSSEDRKKMQEGAYRAYEKYFKSKPAAKKMYQAFCAE